MSRREPLACAALLGLLLAACDGKPGAGLDVPNGPSAAAAPPPPSMPLAFDAGPVRTAAEYLTEPRFAAADLARGELLSLACAACHTFRVGQGTLVGPNLNGVFGRPAGVVESFDYSPALAASGLVWTPVSLEAWLADPAGFVMGTTMTFSGYQSAKDRRDLIAYLLRVTQ